jgi:hypothetical protein
MTIPADPLTDQGQDLDAVETSLDIDVFPTSLLDYASSALTATEKQLVATHHGAHIVLYPGCTALVQCYA